MCNRTFTHVRIKGCIMAGIYTRKAIAAILNDESLTPEERTDQLFSLYGRAIDDGYTTKSAAEAAKNAAIERAKTDAIKDYKAPDPKESEVYIKLQKDFDAYKAKQDARLSEDFAGVKPKFFDAVYDRIDRADGAKPVKEQIELIKQTYEEYFEPTEDAKPTSPQFAAQTKGEMPKGDGNGTFASYWGYRKE